METKRQHPGIELGRWMRLRRQHLGMSQEMVANRMEMDIDRNWITQVENGRRRNLPDHDVLNALSIALRVPVTEVLRGAGILPEGVEQAPEPAPGTATIHALVDMVDWTENPANRQNVEGLLRLILDRQQGTGQPTNSAAEMHSSP